MTRTSRDTTTDIRTLSVGMTDDHTRALARRAVARWATGVDDARTLLDMLDLRPRPGEAP